MQFKSFNPKPFLLVVMLMLTCMHYDNNNPYDPDYPASKYKFHVNWHLLDTTCLINKEYKIPCTTNTGQDTFISFEISRQDTNLKAQIAFCAYDTFKLTFENEFKGEITIVANRPNLGTFSESHEIIVINQFKPRIIANSDFYQTIKGTIDRFIIFVTDTVDSMFTVYSQTNGSLQVDSTKVKHSLSVVNNPCTLAIGQHDSIITHIKAWVKNANGLISDTVNLNVVIASYVPVIGKVFFPSTINYLDTLRFALNVDSNVSSFKVIVKSVKSGDYCDTSGIYPRNGDFIKVTMPPVADTGKMQMQITIFDIKRKTISIPEAESLYVDPLLPILLDGQSIQLPLNDSQQIEVSNIKNVADSIHWIMGKKGIDPYAIDTTTAKKSLVVYFSKQFVDTMSVLGINKFHFTGPISRIVIKAEELPYHLHVDESLFPSNIPALDTSRFAVTIDSTIKFKDKKGQYYWRIDSLGIFVDSMSGPQFSSIERYFPDSSRFEVSVIARDSSGDSSNRVKKIVTVHRYAPSCWFEKKVDTLFIPNPDTVKLGYLDPNPDGRGRIDSVFLDFNDDGIFEVVRSKNAPLNVPNEIAGKVGSHTIRAFVKDNNSFASLVDSMELVVNSTAPYISENISDKSILINTPISIRAKFLVSSGQPPITKYTWRINGIVQPDETTDVLTRTFTTVGIDTIIVHCVTQFSISPMDTFSVHVYSNALPVVYGMKPDTVWISDDTLDSINCATLKPNAPIMQYNISWDTGDTISHYSTPSFKKKYSIAGPHYIEIFVVDKDLQTSDVFHDTVWVRKAAPLCDSVVPDIIKTNIFVNKTQTFSVWAHDSNGTIDSAKIIWNTGVSEVSKSKQSANSGTSFSHTFSTADVGQVQLRALVKDDDGLLSDTLRYTVQVRLGKPEIRPLKKDSSITINSHHNYTISAWDSVSVNAIDSFFISFNDGATYRGTKDSICDTSFTTTGKRYIKTFVKNNRGLLSTTLRDSINVLSHNSSISLITISIDKLKDSVFINNQIKFTVSGKDSLGGKIKTVAFAWKGNQQYSDSITNVSDSLFIIPHTFNVSDTSTKGVRIRLTNDRGQQRDSVFPITIRIGKPVVDAIAPTNIWVNDDTTFVITVHDTNGYVDSLSINWGDGTPISYKGKTDIIKHKYAISNSGAKMIKIVAIDNNDVNSDTGKLPINVRLGKPSVTKLPNNDTMVWNDTMPGNNDTMTCPFRSGTTTIAVRVSDSNGTVKQVFWNVNNGLYSNSGPSTIWSTNYLTKDVSYQFKVWCMDDDSVVSDTMQFYVLPHTPPPNLTGMNYQSQRLFWDGKDPVDLDATEYRLVFKRHVTGPDSILASDANNGCAECTIVPFKTGYEVGKYPPLSLDFDWMFQVATVLKTTGNSYFYKIYPRNSRGQISQSIGQPMFNY
jgi:hypothetical protein